MVAPQARAAAAVGRLVTDSGVAVPLSIVIPVLNEAAGLPAFLERMQVWREHAELILADGGSSDNTAAIARAGCDLLVQADKGRARQMNTAAAMASGRYLLFLHCDTHIDCEPGAFVEALQSLGDWGFCPIRLSGSDTRLRVIERAMNWRSRLTRVATGDQGLVFAAAFFRRLGGYADIPLMEDVEICKRARALASPGVSESVAITSSRRWEEHGLYSTVLKMWHLRLSYWLGASPAQLARRYYG